MAEIGKINKLKYIRTIDYGAQMDGGELGYIILAKKDIPPNAKTGDVVEAFVYEDKDKHLLATTRKPYATVGEFAKLKVAATVPSGAYLDWGMKKDLFVHKTEQKIKMEKGKSYLVYVYIDEKSKRIAASSILDKFLNLRPANYMEGEDVELVIREKTDLGFKAIINHAHQGMIFKNEIFQKLHIGQKISGYIKKIREDRKIDLSLQKLTYQRVDNASQAIWDTIKAMGGKITVTDKSSPDDIYALFAVSKKTFKRAIGALYKRELIKIDSDCIKIKPARR